MHVSIQTQLLKPWVPKWVPDFSTNWIQINQISIPRNRSEIDPKSSKLHPGDPLRASWAHLGAHGDPKVAPRSIFERFWDAFGGHFGDIFRSKFHHISWCFFRLDFDWFFIDFGTHFRRFFEAKQGSDRIRPILKNLDFPQVFLCFSRFRGSRSD